MLRRLLFVFALFTRLPVAGQGLPAPTDTAQVRAQLGAAWRLLARNNDSALALNRQLLRASQRLQFAYGVAQSCLQLGTALRNASEFDSSFYYARRAQALFEAQHRPDGVAWVLNLNAQTYKRMGDAQGVELLTRKGLEQARQALALARSGPYPAVMVSALTTQGIIYRDLNLPDSARACYQEAMRVELQHRPEPSSLGVVYANYGQLLMDYDRNYPPAIGYFRRALAQHRAQHNRNGLEHAYRQLSWAYRLQGRHPQAVAAADTCLALGRAIGDPHRLSNSLEAACFAYRDAGRYREATELMEERRLLDNNTNRLEKTQAVARIEAAYRLEKQQARIASLALANARKQKVLLALGVGLSVLAGLLAFGAWQYRAQRRANAQLRATNQTVVENNARIQEQATRLTLLLRELHHRVKNNLAIVSSLLNLQSGSLADPVAARAVREGRQRVEAMGLIHQGLYQTEQVVSVDMRPYLTTLVENLLAAYGFDEDRFDLVLELDLPAVDVDRAVPLGLILNELVTNALKHAYARVARPLLRVYLGSPAGGLLLEVEDNGPGRPPGYDTGNSFGTQLIAALSQQIGGEMTMSNEPGACFRLWVPAAAVLVG
ncbi:sensor histidine kinase [Hymenobacter sp. BT523]|uniref:sensor histidine kinase n=1 Tax=Hymenobacter sp. BT523 TaxID=2795725 RepID=UPI0018EAEB8B|nr:sensor histidine kinase [Hymenobacter sp. BT523]MBJ6111815.1 sensor histidine kinase [Hymenobacter sp. BT523]